MDYDVTQVDKVMEDYGKNPVSIIGMLQDIQTRFRFIPREAVRRLSEVLNIPESQIYHIVTFYKAFSLVARGKHEIRVCLGTACHISGGKRIAEGFENTLNVQTGHTTKDGQFTLETVNCVGACGLAPVVMVDEEVHGMVKPSKIAEILGHYK
ncbi:MAG: NAD(P)H-dependent oxidoreductase subunit E [Deltaproteobacteria bacterium]|nr:NAD(P)H-dependent oxidoreductase subunit E [Candidatus Zymogenaceae bacterium]